MVRQLDRLLSSPVPNLRCEGSFRYGVVFPQTSIGTDPTAVRDFAQAVEELGYDHILVYDHVLGAGADSRPGWSGTYRHTDMFHEVFVLFGYLAAVTARVELATGILILPQRQTALVAKQAATLDVLSGGRFRLGVGVGWNSVEYEALGRDFTDRGRRADEQVDVLKRLWTRELVTYEGKWHRITDAGLNPMPVQRPIPLWFGGIADPVLRRIGRLGDGWIVPSYDRSPLERHHAALAQIRSQAREAGRDPGEIGVEKVFGFTTGWPADWARVVRAWELFGATHVSISTMEDPKFDSLDAHIDAIRQFREDTKAV